MRAFSYRFLGPFALHEHLYNTRTGSVFRVTDKNENVFSLKAFSYFENVASGHKERRLFDFANERTYLTTITRAVCPSLLSALSSTSTASVMCANHHVQLMLGLDVVVLNESGAALGLAPLMIANSDGDESERQFSFTTNILLPYMQGGRLNDLIARAPKYQSMVSRYPLYVDVAPQLIEAVRFLHSSHIVHLSIQASTVLCSNVNCDEAVLAEPTNAWNGEGASSLYANELMQQSVRFSQFAPNSDSQHDLVSPVFTKYLEAARHSVDWTGTLTVDWYGLGGTLFYILSGIRPVAEDRSGPNSHDAAEFIYIALQSKQLLAQVVSPEAKTALSKIRNQVTEGLLLVDGLLQTDRKKRISFDGVSHIDKTRNSLRSGKALISAAIQLDEGVSSCMQFFAHSTAESDTLKSLPLKEGMPSFIQGLCSK